MNRNTKDELDNKEKFMDENFPSIQFKRKKIKSNIKAGGKLIILFVLAGLTGALFSSFTMEVKYKDVFKQINKKIEDDTVDLEYSELIEKVNKSLVTISDSEENLTQNSYFNSNSTGIIIDSNGKILTNYSKIKNLENIYVKLPYVGSKPINAEFVAGNEDIDMAIIQINYTEELIPIKLAAKTDKMEGQQIVLISNSVGDDYIDNIIPGVVTSTNRSIAVNNRAYDLLEINTPITPINTGGAICNLNGELIGVTSYKVNNDMNQSGLYYAVNLNSLEEIINSTNKIKDMLGVLEGGFINDENNSNVAGFYVERIKKGRSSYGSGLRPTDIIFEIDGSEITNIEEMYDILKNKKVGDTLNCKVMRAGKVKSLEIKLE